MLTYFQQISLTQSMGIITNTVNEQIAELKDNLQVDSLMGENFTNLATYNNQVNNLELIKQNILANVNKLETAVKATPISHPGTITTIISATATIASNPFFLFAVGCAVGATAAYYTYKTWNVTPIIEQQDQEISQITSNKDAEIKDLRQRLRTITNKYNEEADRSKRTLITLNLQEAKKLYITTPAYKYC